MPPKPPVLSQNFSSTAIASSGVPIAPRPSAMMLSRLPRPIAWPPSGLIA
jgi:hypothetical protein